MHLLAHLRPLGAVHVADPVRRRQADAQHVGRRALAQLLGVQQVFSGLQRLLVQQGRGVELQPRRRQGRMEGLAANGPVPGQRPALVIRVIPGDRRQAHAQAEVAIEVRHGRQLGLRRLARLDIGGQAEALGEPEGLTLMAGQIDRAPVLARDGEDLALRADDLQPVAQGRGAQLFWADRAVVDVVASVRQVVGGRGQAIDFLAGLAVDPVVGGDSGLGRMHARQNRRVAGAGLGQAVGLIAVDRHQPLVRHPAQAARVAAAVLVEQIGAELVHHDGDDQLRRRQGRNGGLWSRGRRLALSRHRWNGGADKRNSGQGREGGARQGHELTPETGVGV